MSMICDHATKCGDKANGCCVISRPHVCKDCHPEDGGLTFCYIAERYVRCIPDRKPRSYDAEGRAARLECIRYLRNTRALAQRHPTQYMKGVRAAYEDILEVMRDARKGEK
jgi:hypothetical protein